MYYDIRLGELVLLKSFSILFIFKRIYLVKLCPIIDGSTTSCLTMYQKILWSSLWGCINVFNLICLTMKFHNRHHATVRSQLTPNNLSLTYFERWVLKISKHCCQNSLKEVDCSRGSIFYHGIKIYPFLFFQPLILETSILCQFFILVLEYSALLWLLFLYTGQFLMLNKTYHQDGYGWFTYGCHFINRGLVGTGATGAWHPQNFEVLYLAPVKFWEPM